MEDKKNNMDEGFVIKYTNKEIYQKLEQIHNDINSVKTQVAVTNGKVKLHTKLIWALGSALMVLFITILKLNIGG